MKSNRRKFLKVSGATGVGAFLFSKALPFTSTDSIDKSYNMAEQTVIGNYGEWAKSLTAKRLPRLSFRNKNIPELDVWKKMARSKVRERMAIPDIGGVPKVTVVKQYEYDGLHIEELTWQLPYGRPTEAVLLKPANATGRLPGVIAFHDHGGNKFYGSRKIVRLSDKLPVGIEEHQKTYYEGKGWANELARKGYVVLVPDAFPFASRRVMISEVPEARRGKYKDPDPNNLDQIEKYNEWASDHEHIMGKSLFSAGTTWPGVWIAEDIKALDVFCTREDVQLNNIGCAGLSGGGMRSVYLAGLDDRIKCTVPVGFMTTWNDFALYKSYTHTWMIYIPLLPTELDFPEILTMRVPLPSLVLNNSEDQLFTLSEMQRADQITKEIYAKANAADSYRCTFHPGPHKFDSKMQAEAFAWFDQWLKKE
ncbi:MAG TPA: twin-arginine translocation signal domain-containing protein [Cyclobacteriaceae bacterium]|nr:twin-arginine translocation signal domain-containing protein [Cyclobacteriaceae bacterium]